MKINLLKFRRAHRAIFFKPTPLFLPEYNLGLVEVFNCVKARNSKKNKPDDDEGSSRKEVQEDIPTFNDYI